MNLVTRDCYYDHHPDCIKLVDTEYGFVACSCPCHTIPKEKLEFNGS